MASGQQDRIFGLTGDTAIKSPVDCAVSFPITLSGEQTIDGFSTSGSRVLVAGQADASFNGIYISDTGAWSRAPDFDGNGDAVYGTFLTVSYGTAFAGSMWRLTVSENPPIIGQDDLTFAVVQYMPQVPGAVDNLLSYGAVSNAPGVTYVGLSATGPDRATGLGIIYDSWGTTTSPLQFNGLVETHTGRQKFRINGQYVLQLTDTYWNPNNPYDGHTNTWGVISSGWCAPGSDGLAVLSAECSEPTNIGCGWILGAKGQFGQMHFLSNGALGHFTVSSIPGVNPNGTDEYVAPNNIRICGAFPGSNLDCLIFTQLSGNAGDTTAGMSFYNEGAGSYKFVSDNTASAICTLQRVANAVNQVVIAGGASGVNPIVYAGGSGGNRLTIAGIDTGSVDICNGAQYNGTAACAPIARFFGGFEPTNYFEFTAGTVATLTTNGGDLLLEGGSGFIAFGTYTATPGTITGYITIHDQAGTARKLAVTT